MARTTVEIQADIDIFRTAIRNIALTGKEYEVGTGPSKRIFRAEDLPNLRDYLADLESELDSVNGTDGVLMGF